MSERRIYVTTSIPYVNGDPHVGFALECVQGDVLARHYRARGAEVRFLSGTDDNALKNVEAATAAGMPVAEFVAAKAKRFAALRERLDLSYDDFISTSVDARHRPGVERLWRTCEAAGDLYERHYEGLYCPGCEAFVQPDELRGGLCPEHARPPERLAERNWFFRLSGYQREIEALIEDGRLRIEPEQRRNEALAFVRSGLQDFSVSRAADRAHGWGIPVPGDPSQVVYVWFDALANYITALGFGAGDERFHKWWREADERIHVIGKGILRFHTIYWPGILLSAGLALPTRIYVHDYVTASGAKLSKSGVAGADPFAVVEAYGADALRWWFARGVPRNGDVDFRDELVAARATELADELGNLVNRVIALAGEKLPGDSEGEVGAASLEAAAAVDAALDAFDIRAASDAVWSLVTSANRFVSSARPWELRGAERARVVGQLLHACSAIAGEIAPFLPEASERISRALGRRDRQLGRTLFAKPA
jgi:methionyl-tRNA synthetase